MRGKISFRDKRNRTNIKAWLDNKRTLKTDQIIAEAVTETDQ